VDSPLASHPQVGVCEAVQRQRTLRYLQEYIISKSYRADRRRDPDSYHGLPRFEFVPLHGRAEMGIVAGSV